jgi:hypothetical protein
LPLSGPRWNRGARFSQHETTMLFAALIPTMLCEPFGDGPELCLYGLFMRAVVFRYRPFTPFGRSVPNAANQVSRVCRKIMRERVPFVGRAAERRVLPRRLAGRRIDSLMIFDVAPVPRDRILIA